jgi:hypothetical protein
MSPFVTPGEALCKELKWRLKMPEQVVLTDKKPRRAPAAELAHIDELLDEALKGTFPASDPVAIDIEHGADERESLKSSRFSTLKAR